MSNTISTKYVGGSSANIYQPYCAILTIDTYATGGVALPINGFKPEIVVGCECADGTNAYEPSFDMTNMRLKLFSGSTEVSAGSITSTTFHITFFGRVA